jgi:thiamine kinase-like enzyme
VPTIDPDVASILRRVPVLDGATAVVELSGGLTNRNLKVTTPSGVYVLRISSNETSLLAVDREAEYRNSIAAAEAGVGALVVGYLPGQGVMVVEFLEGRTFTEADLRDPRNLPRVAEACRRLHAGPRFATDFDIFRFQRRYLAVVQERGFRLPDRYVEFAPAVEQIRTALSFLDAGTVPCHNDLHAGNFIDPGDVHEGGDLRLIDYEYSGNNDPCFELGTIWSEAVLPIEDLELLVTAYYGRDAPEKVARAQLLGLMSKYSWTMWASVQDAVSTIDFDFWSWGLEEYEYAVAMFTADGFDDILSSAAGDAGLPRAHP